MHWSTDRLCHKRQEDCLWKQRTHYRAFRAIITINLSLHLVHLSDTCRSSIVINVQADKQNVKSLNYTRKVCVTIVNHYGAHVWLTRDFLFFISRSGYSRGSCTATPEAHIHILNIFEDTIDWREKFYKIYVPRHESRSSRTSAIAKATWMSQPKCLIN